MELTLFWKLKCYCTVWEENVVLWWKKCVDIYDFPCDNKRICVTSNISLNTDDNIFENIPLLKICNHWDTFCRAKPVVHFLLTVRLRTSRILFISGIFNLLFVAVVFSSALLSKFLRLRYVLRVGVVFKGMMETGAINREWHHPYIFHAEGIEFLVFASAFGLNFYSHK